MLRIIKTYLDASWLNTDIDDMFYIDSISSFVFYGDL